MTDEQPTPAPEPDDDEGAATRQLADEHGGALPDLADREGLVKDDPLEQDRAREAAREADQPRRIA